MPKNAFFKEDREGRGGEGHVSGQQLLFNVVHAYAIHDSEVGYSQGINFLAAVLLLHMKQEQAFWVLVQLMRRYRVRGLFLSNNPQLAMEHLKLSRLTVMCTPSLHQLFTEQGVDISLFTSEWLITLFSYTFPLSFTFRVWDILLVKGFTYILQVLNLLAHTNTHTHTHRVKVVLLINLTYILQVLNLVTHTHTHTHTHSKSPY